MADVKTLGLRVVADGAAKAAGDLDKVAGAADKAEASADRYAASQRKMSAAIQSATSGMSVNASGLNVMTGAVGNLSQAANAASAPIGRLTAASGALSTGAGGVATAATAAAGGLGGYTAAANTASAASGRLSAILSGGLTKAFAAIGALVAGGALVSAADGWSDLQSVVGAAIGDMERAPAVMQDILRIANETYSPLEQTASGFARNVATLNDLGVSTQGALQYTSALNNALVITATRGDRAASVQDALSKAMATGRLQADGLETVLANGGRVAQALAAELGTNVSGLRALSSEGKITGDVISSALINRYQQLADEAAQMPSTVTDGFVRIRNGLTAVIGSFDQATGATGLMASGLNAVADGLGILAAKDPSAMFSALTGVVVGLGQALLVVGGARLVSVAAGMTAASASTALVTVQTAAATAASRAHAVAMAAQAAAARGLAAAMAFVGGPVGLAVAAFAGLALQLYNTRSQAEAVRASISDLAVAQDDLNQSVTRFYANRNEDNLRAMQTGAQAVQAQIQTAIATAQQELSNASFYTNFFGTSLFETERMREGQAHIDALNKSLQESETRLALIEIAAADYAAELGRARGLSQSLTQEQAKSHDSLTGMLADLNRTNVLRAAEVTYGRDSAQYLAIQQQHEREILDAKLASVLATLDGVQGASQLADQIRAALGEQQQAEAGAQRWAAAMANVKGQVDAILGALAGLGGGFMDRVSINAQNAALDAGQTAAQAQLAGRRAQEDQRRSDQRATLRRQFGNTFGNIAANAMDIEVQQRRQMEDALAARYSALSETNRGGGGAGGASEAVKADEQRRDAIQGVISSLQQEIDVIGMSETQKKVYQALQHAGVSLYSQEGQQIDQLVQKQQMLLDYNERIQQQSELGKQALQTMFGAVLDGSMSAEEAVKRLLIQMAQVKAMKSIMGIPGIGGGGGIASQIGGLLSFDGGGYTGNRARSGGLDGKGAFLAMLHPQETVIDHTKGHQVPNQSQGNTMAVTIDLRGTTGDKELDAKLKRASEQTLQQVPGFMANHNKRRVGGGRQ